MSQQLKPSKQYQCDVLIIGSGAAGLSLALRLASHTRVAVLAKAPLNEGSTRYAQGGISAVLDPADSVESHFNDTLSAGGILCDEAVVRFTTSRSKQQIDWLLELGMAFTQNEDAVTRREVRRETGREAGQEFHLTREGGHSHRRVIHSADTTGKSLSETLISQVKKQPNITLFEHHIAIDLISSTKKDGPGSQVQGAYVLDRKAGNVEVFRARKIVLATGGASKVYLYTSNPDVSTGDGIAMAWRAGCRIANMEFIQFHPTCLYHPQAKSFLLSEAIRGEGGRLLLPDGTRFMEAIDPRAELAPRDVVARAIDHEMKRRGLDHVLLDISHKPADFIRKHFPNIYQRCLDFGYDMTRQALPVVPAAHYTCGGVVTDICGRTDVSGLYAIGETAHTGLHGANRMASNSLLECLVFAESTAQDIDRQLDTRSVLPLLPEWDESRVTNSDEQIVVSHNWDELRRFMWDYVGIVRTDKRLERAMRRVTLLEREIDEYYSNFRVTNDLIELRNLVLVAKLIIRSAMTRKESRGLHYTLDYPQADESQPPQDTILTPRRYQSVDDVATIPPSAAVPATA